MTVSSPHFHWVNVLSRLCPIWWGGTAPPRRSGRLCGDWSTILTWNLDNKVTGLTAAGTWSSSDVQWRTGAMVTSTRGVVTSIMGQCQDTRTWRTRLSRPGQGERGQGARVARTRKEASRGLKALAKAHSMAQKQICPLQNLLMAMQIRTRKTPEVVHQFWNQPKDVQRVLPECLELISLHLPRLLIMIIVILILTETWWKILKTQKILKNLKQLFNIIHLKAKTMFRD